MNTFTKIFDTLANMGIWIRLNDPRREPPKEEGRLWGDAVDGLRLSLAPLDEDSVSVLMKNDTDTERRLALPSWLNFLQVHVFAPDGAPVPLKPYGEQVLAQARTLALTERVFPPRKYLATDIPVRALYQMAGAGPFRLSVSCLLPGASAVRLASNEIFV